MDVKTDKKRSLEAVIPQVSASFPVLLVTGPRQVGKTTLLQACAEPTRGYVTLDDLEQRALARQDPALFLQMHPAPVIIDEIQYAPELFSAIKIIVDKEKKNGLFWLTGSQKFHLMQNVSESLAGRVAILDMLGFSQAEIEDRCETSPPFLPTVEWCQMMTAAKPQVKSAMDVYRAIWLGSFPKLVLDKTMSRDLFYNSYVQTYIQRDVRLLARIGDELTFQRFLRALAARTGQLINYVDLARDVDIDQRTLKTWLSIVVTSGLVYLLQPYHDNITNRFIKTPKLYFLDTGLCSYLTQWTTPEALEAGAMSGALLETYIFTEILKSYWHHAKEGNFYFYRDKDKREIDLLIVENNTLYPLEFKKTATPSQNAVRHFHVLENTKMSIGKGAVICLKDVIVALSRDTFSIPVSYI